MTRFRGTFLALGALVIVLVLWRSMAPSNPDPEVEQEALFRFDKDALAGVEVVTPQHTLQLARNEGVWQVVGQPWRPSKAMIRRIAHQLHDLDARATVVDDPEDPSIYGLGPDAIEVTLTIEGAQPVSFRVGDPNPTSVSYYMQRMPEERVYVVKKSAMDFYRFPPEAFREDRITQFDTADAVRLQSTVGAFQIDVERTGPHAWRMTHPVAQQVDLDEVRSMLGRVSALRALEFVEDGPADLARYELGPTAPRIVVTLGSGGRISVRVGHMLPEGQGVGGVDASMYLLHQEDDAVYAVKSGWLSSFERHAAELRNRDLVAGSAWEIRRIQVGDPMAVVVERRAEQWRWMDGSAISGSTPKRLAQRTASLRAEAFHGSAPPRGFGPPFASLTVTFEGGEEVQIGLGRRFESPSGDKQMRQYAIVDDEHEVYEVDGDLAEVIEDLWREFRRKQAREADKRLEGPR